VGPATPVATRTPGRAHAVVRRCLAAIAAAGLMLTAFLTPSALADTPDGPSVAVEQWDDVAGAVQAACDGGTIELAQHITAGSNQTLDLAGCALTLDLAGHDLDIENVNWGVAAIRVPAGASLTVMD